MSTYTKTTNFTAKDNLTSGDPAKVIKGSEFDTEFNAIETAVNSKADKNNGTHTGTTTIATADIDNLQIDSVAVTATAAELNTLDGITASTAELNITDGLTATTAELNTLDGITSTTTELNKLDGFTGDVTDLNKLASVTATATEINVLDGSTATTADLNKLAGVTATSTELNLLDGVTATTAELNYVDGVTSNIQTQLDNKQPLDAQLTDIAGLTPTDGTFIVGNGTNFVAESGDTAIASLGITATATELNTLDGITASTAELNHTDGVTSNIQTQLDAMVEKAGDTMTGDLSLGDDVKAKFGASDDLQIYHDGSNSYIHDAGTGNLNIIANQFALYEGNGTDLMIGATPNGAVTLSHNATTRLATTATGVDVTGTVTADAVDTTSVSCDGLTVEGNNTGGLSVPNNTITLLDTDTSSTAGQAFGAINFSSSDTSDAGTPVRITGVCEFGGSVAGSLQFETGTPSNLTKAMQISYNGDVSFYEDTGTTAKFVWDASAEELEIGSSTDKLELGASFQRFRKGNENKILIGNTSSALGSGTGLINYLYDPEPFIWYQGAERMRIDSSGNVGIGTSSPSSQLHIGGQSNGKLRIDTTASGYLDCSMYSNGAFIGTSSATQPLRLGTNNSERVRIDSSGRVGIGTSSPLSRLHVVDATNISMNANGTGQLHLEGNGYSFGIALDGSNANLYTNSASRGISFGTNETERMRIDSSGNLLVGTTQVRLTEFGQTSSGINLLGQSGQEGQIQAQTSGTPVLIASRRSSDGDIIQLRKDGSTVGSIGTSGGDLTNGTGDTGLKFNDSLDAIVPWNTSTNALRDATIDLATANNRFKDLYLSGGVYLGGTGSVNKLDDYETGTFTPVVIGSTTAGTASYTTQFGQYTKIGDTVHFHLIVNYNSLTGTGQLRVVGLPFNSKSSHARIATVGMANISYSGDYVYAFTIAGTNQFGLAAVNNGAGTSTLGVDTAGIIEITGTYHT